jgi:hypothetical protein
MQCHIPVHHGGDTIQGLTEHHVPGRQSLTKQNVNQQDGVSSAASMTKDMFQGLPYKEKLQK